MLCMWIITILIWCAQTATYPNDKTATYCALALAFDPPIKFFESIVPYCKQDPVPSISCDSDLNICGDDGITDNLYYLDLSFNHLSGTIPTEFGNLNNLQRLYLNYNEFSGTIPTEFGNLKNISYLYLHSNDQISGTIPTEFGNLKKLIQLILSSNELSGTIPTEIGNLNNLVSLDFSSNQFSGTIPTEFGNLNNIDSLYLSFNELSGTIPTEIGNLNNLQQLYLNYNNLTGTIPSQIGTLITLSVIQFSSNELSGTIPKEFGKMTNLRSVDLSVNQLWGTIPREFRNMTNLRSVDLSVNQLWGTIPSQFGKLNNLNFVLNLADNNLSGTIPPELGNLNNLEKLDFSNNRLSGPLPSNFSSWTVNTISLTNNFLTGNITIPSSTQALFLSNNRFTQVCLDDQNQKNYPLVWTIRNNDITSLDCGFLTNPLVKVIINSYSFDASNNPLLSFPSFIEFPFLQELKLSNCMLSGSLDNLFSIFYKFSSLSYLDISNNLLTGTIPKLFPSLSTLDISRNSLFGSLPNGKYPDNLESFYISNNNIHGSIPSSLTNLESLTSIDLSETNICSQSFPSEWIIKRWSYCNLEISYPCGIEIPATCTMNTCVKSLRCFVDQCAEGTHLCEQPRKCIFNPDWSYSCSDCSNTFYRNDDEFKCAVSVNGIIIPFVLTIIIIVIIFGIILYLLYNKYEGKGKQKSPVADDDAYHLSEDHN